MVFLPFLPGGQDAWVDKFGGNYEAPEKDPEGEPDDPDNTKESVSADEANRFLGNVEKAMGISSTLMGATGMPSAPLSSTKETVSNFEVVVDNGGNQSGVESEDSDVQDDEPATETKDEKPSIIRQIVPTGMPGNNAGVDVSTTGIIAAVLSVGALVVAIAKS